MFVRQLGRPAQRPPPHGPAIVPSSRADRLPVLLLGKHITALGVLRVLARDGIEVLGVEDTTDVITHSRWYRPAETRIAETTDPEVLAGYLRGLRLPRAVLIACSDRWSRAVAGLPADVRGRFPASISPAAVVAQLVDKAKFRDLVERLGIPAPASIPIRSVADLESVSDEVLGNGFLKPTDSQTYARATGTKGAFVTSQAAAAAVVAAGVEAGVTFELQEFVSGPIGNTILLDGFVDRTGRITAMSARRRVRMDPPLLANTCCDVMIRLDEVADAAAVTRRLLAEVAYRGVFNVEFKLEDRDGQYKIIEVNPRPFWLVSHVARAGLDLPLMSYLDAQGLPVPRVERYEVGRYGLYEMPDAAAIIRALASHRRPDGPVLRSWLLGDHAVFWPSDPMPGLVDLARGIRRRLGGATLPAPARATPT
jgi:predicted ATP-grasp superfamily ATP-dependent carboligase